MADLDPKLPLTGSNVRFQMFVGGRPVVDVTALIKTGDVEQVATMFSDKYLGRKRDRKDKKVTGYKMAMEFDTADLSIVKEIDAIDALIESNTPAPEMSFGVELAERLGTFEGFVIRKCVASYKIGMKGKDERVPLSLTIEGEDKLPVSF
jgi:hypothetical protein